MYRMMTFILSFYEIYCVLKLLITIHIIIIVTTFVFNLGTCYVLIYVRMKYYYYYYYIVQRVSPEINSGLLSRATLAWIVP